MDLLYDSLHLDGLPFSFTHASHATLSSLSSSNSKYLCDQMFKDSRNRKEISENRGLIEKVLILI